MNSNINVDEIVKQVFQKIRDVENVETIGIFDDMNQAVEACFVAQKELVKLSLEQRGKIVDAIRKVSVENAVKFAEDAVSECGMGNVPDKILKNTLAANKSPGIEDLKTESFTGDNGLTLIELSPFGIIGAITPTTNPTETIICNSIGMIAAGNGVVFSPHPSAKNVSIYAITVINKAIVAAGGPKNIITTVNNPTMEQVQIMMTHKKINMLCATGGPGVVKSVLSSGKKAIGAGAGNPPAVVDETADIVKAAKDIVDGASFDNNLPCIAEKEVLVVSSVADYLIFNMQSSGAHLLTDRNEIKKLEALVLEGDGVNKKFIGKDATYILDKLDISYKQGTKLIIVETDFTHPFVQHELMMPVLPIVRVNDIDEAIELAIRAEHGFRHTSIMHSKNIDNLTRLGKELQTTIFVKNAPSYAGIGVGGEGYTTFTIAGPTGEGLTSAKSFSRKRRCVLVNGFAIM